MADPWLDHMTVDYDEDQRCIVMHRGSLAIACNLNADEATVPVTGERVMAWRADYRRRPPVWVGIRSRYCGRAIRAGSDTRASRLQRLDVNIRRLHPLEQTLEVGGQAELDADQRLARLPVVALDVLEQGDVSLGPSTVVQEPPSAPGSCGKSTRK